MKHDLFENMKKQMIPDDETVNDLLHKISKLEQPQTIKKKWIPVAACAACIVAAVSVAYMYPKFINNGGNEWDIIDTQPVHSNDTTLENPSQGEETPTPDHIKVPEWEDRSLQSKFDRICIDDQLFFSTQKEIAKERVGNLLFKTTLETQDYNNPKSDKIYYIDAEVYSITSINQKYAVAIKYSGQNNYYSYAISEYTPQSLGEFIDDFNLKDNMTLGRILYDGEKQKEYTLSDKNTQIWEFLSDNRSAKYFDPLSERVRGGELGIEAKIDVIGQDNDTHIGVSRDGYIITNLCGSLFGFDIGKEKANQFIDYVLENALFNQSTSTVS